MRDRFAHAPLSLVLGVGLGLLLLLASGSILLVGYLSARSNTFALLQDKAELILGTIEQRIRDHLDPVGEQVRYLQSVVHAGEVDLDDPAALVSAFRAALAATPQVVGLAYITTEFRVIRVERADRKMRIEDWSNRPEVVANVTAALDDSGAGWRPPVWSAPFRQTLVPLTLPIHHDGQAHGVLVAAIVIADLSRFLARVASPDQTPFILYGTDRVLAHPQLAMRDPQGALDRPLRPIGEVADSTLAMIWSEQRQPLIMLRGSSDEGHSLTFADGSTIYIAGSPGTAQCPG